MSDATMKHAALVEALKDLHERLGEFALFHHSRAVFAAMELLCPNWGLKVSRPLTVCCLRALVIEWPEEADTLHAAALACQAMQQEAC